MDKATPTPSPASVDSFMSLLRNHENRISETYGVLQDRRIPSEEVRAAIDASSEARNALIAEVERLAAQSAPTEPKHPLLNITAKQLRAALDFANPDPDDPDQLEAKVCIQWGEARDDGDGGTEPAGLRAWLAECPEEGSISLDLWGTEGGLV